MNNYKNNNLNIKNILGSFLIVLSCFPYLSLIDTPFDTQPYALIFSIISIVIFSKSIFKYEFKIPLSYMLILLVLAYASVLTLFSDDLLNGARSYVGYISIAVITFATYLLYPYIKGKILLYISLFWLIIGIIQMLFDKTFGNFILPRLSTSDLRGVTSLATEPSYYAIMCIMFFILNDIFHARGDYSKKIYILVFILNFVQLIFSRTGLGFMLLIIYLMCLFVFQGDIKRKLKLFITSTLLLIMMTGLFTLSSDLQQTRLGIIIYRLFNSPSDLLFKDGSIADRFLHIVISHLSIIKNYGMGHGLGQWNDNALELSQSFGEFVHQVALVNITMSGRIMSGWGTAIFELGLIGFLLIVFYFRLMVNIYRKGSDNMKNTIGSFVAFYAVTLMAVPLSFPLIGVILGIMMYESLSNNMEELF